MIQRECNSCGRIYDENSIKLEQCEYCDKFYCIYCMPAHKEEIHGK